MSTRRFTVAEANAITTDLRPLLAQLIAFQTTIDEDFQLALGSLPEAYQNVGNPAASRLAKDFDAIEQILERIKSYGCQLKDIRLGLIDFPAEINGREVNLCWRFDEDEIRFYHDLDEGYDSRRPLDDEQ